MTQSILQFQSTDPSAAATATSLAFASNVTAGSTILVATLLNFTALGATPFTDTLGNTYTLVTKAQSSAGPGNQTLYLYAAYNSPAGANTVQLNLASSSSIRPLLILEVGGTAAAPLDGSAHNDQASPGTGAGAVLSGSASNAHQPALAIGLSIPLFVNSPPAAVSPYTSQGTFFGGGSGSTGRCEYQNLTATSSQQATFTATAGTTEHLSLLVVLDAAGPPTVTLNASAIVYSYTVESTTASVSANQLLALPVSYGYALTPTFSDLTLSEGVLSYVYTVEDAQPTAGIARTLAAAAIVYSYTVESAVPSSSPVLRVRAVDSGWYNGVYYQPGDVFDLLSPTDFSDATVDYGPNSETTQYGWMTEVPLTTPLLTASVAQPIPLFPVIDPVPPRRFVY